MKPDDQAERRAGMAEISLELAHINRQLSETKGGVQEVRQELHEGLRDLKESVESRYVTHDRFQPVERLAYGVTGAMLLAVVGALMALILR